MAQKQKAVVLFSGGVDSTTCLALAIERFGKENVVPLSIQYGQKHSKELEAAANVLSYYGIEGKTMDVTNIYYGAHADDAAGNAYPDCTETFYTSMGNAIFEGSGKECSLEAPFINRNKADVVREGLRLGVPYELTWSCYEGGDHPCGHCGTCIDRQEAFRANGVEDPSY